MHIRIRLSRSTVQDLYSRLQHAYQHDDGRWVRRTTVLSDLLVSQVSVKGLSARWGLSPSYLSHWRQACLLPGVDSVVSRHSGGRRPQLTPTQTHRVGELRAAGPLVVGCETACWDAVLIRVLSWRECGVLYNRQDVCPLLHHLAFSFQQARFVSDHLDAATRRAWLEQKGPTLFPAATRHKGLILFADEARFAPWGSLRYPWARRGLQPEVPPSGKRKGSQVFGAIAYCSGRLF